MHCILLHYFHWNLTKKLLYLYVFHSNTLKDHLQRLKFFCKFILDTKWNDQSSIGILYHRDTYQYLSCLKKHQNHLQVVSFLQSKLLSLSQKKKQKQKTIFDELNHSLNLRITLRCWCIWPILPDYFFISWGYVSM